YADKQLLTFEEDQIFGAMPILKNAPKSLVEGMETTATLVPTEGLYLTAIGSYIRTKIIEFDSTTAQGKSFDFSGRPFNFAPRLQAAFLANYTFPVAADLEFNVGGDYNYNSATNGTLEGDPAYAIRKYYTVGAHVGLAPLDHHWIVTAFGRNLTNS